MASRISRSRGSSSPAIDFVYFDLGNILVEFDPGVGCANVADHAGVSAEAVHAAIYSSGLQTALEHGAVSGEEFAKRVRAALGLADGRFPTARLLDCVSDMFRPIDGMRELIERVRGAGLGVGILSNTCHAHWDWITRQKYAPLAGRFDATILSYEVGAMKPDARIYAAAEAAAGLPPRRLLFIDDRPENVLAAVQRGWHAETCFGGPQAVAVIERYLR